MASDMKALYALMLRSRRFEEKVKDLWDNGLIYGEMHMSVGEEAVVAGVVSQLGDDDAMALDHRGTAPLLMRGEDPVLLMKEFFGRPDGLCGGRGGHMHLFSRISLAVSSGIVGASGPTAVGFAAALARRGGGGLAVAFFGEGSMNQGMLLESMNLASAWRLPVLFVCKDNGLSITTPSPEVTAGDLTRRAEGLGLNPYRTEGVDVESVWRAASSALQGIREGGPPAFLLAPCFHFEGHFLGDGCLRILRTPIKQARLMAGETLQSLISPKGADRRSRMRNIGRAVSRIGRAREEQKAAIQDPLRLAEERLKAEPDWLAATDAAIRAEIESAAAEAFKDLDGRASI